MYRSLINDFVNSNNKIYSAIMDSDDCIKLYLDENIHCADDYDLFVNGNQAIY